MSMKTTRWGFWIITLATLIAMSATASLGFWQLGRAAEKERLAKQRESRQHLPPIGWNEFNQAANGDQWSEWWDRSVELEGKWHHEATVFLENRAMNGRPGFFVVTPLLQDGSRASIAVVRGWIPRRLDDRTALPVLTETSDQVRVIGRLAPPPSKLYDFGEAGTGRIRQNIDLQLYGAEWSLSLWPVSVQQIDAEIANPELLRDWPVIGSDVHKHYGYALQWFGLTSLLLILYVWFQFIAPRRQRHR